VLELLAHQRLHPPGQQAFQGDQALGRVSVSLLLPLLPLSSTDPHNMLVQGAQQGPLVVVPEGVGGHMVLERAEGLCCCCAWSPGPAPVGVVAAAAAEHASLGLALA
jgi:hypothetical protein